MDNKDIEMQSPVPDKNLSGTTPHEDRPPDPPKRDYHSTTREEPGTQKKRFSSFQRVRPEFIYKPDSSESSMTCLKNVLIILNLLIWLFGAVLTGIGIWVQVDREFWDIQTGLDMKQFSMAGYVLIAVGVTIMLFGFVGCYGAMALKMWLLILYAIMIVIIIFLEIAVMAMVWSAIHNKDMAEEMKRRGRKAIQQMAEEDSQRYLIELIQTKLDCCGIEGPDDYGSRTLPHSCTDSKTGYPNEKGCLGQIIAYFKNKAGILGGVAVGVFVLQLAALVLTLCIACGLKQANAIY